VFPTVGQNLRSYQRPPSPGWNPGRTSFLTWRILAAFPNDVVIGEEGAAHQGSSGRLWVIDPIDGTFNFVRGSDQWAVSIGLYENGQPGFGVIHAPARRQILVGGIGMVTTLNGAPMALRSGLDRDRLPVASAFIR